MNRYIFMNYKKEKIKPQPKPQTKTVVMTVRVPAQLKKEATKVFKKNNTTMNREVVRFMQMVVDEFSTV